MARRLSRSLSRPHEAVGRGRQAEPKLVNQGGSHA
jgi:hypothetical protein